MDAQRKALYEQFHHDFFWLDEVFTPQIGDKMPFTDPEQRAIFDEIAANWKEGDIIAVLNDLQQRYGSKVVEVLDLVIGTTTRTGWSQIGQQQPSRTIADFLRLLWDPLPKLGFEFTSTTTADGVQMHCTHCPHVALGEALHAKTWLYHLVCGGDPHMVAGFNPDMGFRRTKTLMQGDAYCDHYYYNNRK